MNAPVQIVFVPFEVGSPKRLREVKPAPYPMQPRDRQWLRQDIPGGPTRRELQQEVRRALEGSKVQIEALRRLAPSV
jgi:hypothetical protein